MLKKLLTLLLEKFIYSKRFWIAETSLPATASGAINVTPEITGDWVIITAPISGYFCVRSISSSLLLSNGLLWQGSNDDTAYHKGFTLPCYKGSEVAYLLSLDTKDAYVFFTKNMADSM